MRVCIHIIHTHTHTHTYINTYVYMILCIKNYICIYNIICICITNITQLTLLNYIEPSVASRTLTKGDDFLILATDGLWNFVDPAQV